MQSIKELINIKRMISKKNILLLSIVFIQLLMFSCKNKENKKTETKVNTLKQIEFIVEFPDTVYVNQKYNGKIKYKSILDTITTSFDDKKKNRYVIFYQTLVDKPDPDYKHLKKVAKMVGADNNREIPLEDIVFNKTGTHYIDGIINDNVVIDLNRTDKEGDSLSRIIENEERVIHKVFVMRKLDKESKGVSVPIGVPITKK